MPYHLEPAGRLSAGLEYLTKQQFDVVLLDLGLPDSQGLEMLNKIYAQTPTTPIVVLTGLDDEAIANQAVREGAQDYLLKDDINGRALWRVIRYAIERKRAEEALRKEKQFAESLIDTAQAIILVLDTTGRVVSFNRYMEEVSGYHLEEVRGRDWFSIFFPEDDQLRTKGLFLKAIDGIQTRGDVNAIITKDGRTRDIEWYDKTLKDENGDTVGLLAIGQDVTERNKLETALIDSEQWYRHIYDNAPFGIGFSSSDGKVITMNKAMEIITGYSVEEFNKVNLADTYVNKADREALLQEIRQHGGVTDYPVQLRRKDGTPYDAILNVRLTSIGDREFLQTICHDITERKQAEESLSLSEQNFRDSMENSPLGVRIVNEDGKTLYANRALLTIYGYSSLKELAAVPNEQRYTPQGYIEHKERVKKRKLREYVPPSYEISIVRKDGQVRELSVSRGEVLWNGEKQFQVLYQDITERKQAGEALLESESKYRSLVETAGAGVASIDLVGNATFVNQSLLEQLGYSEKEIIGKKFAGFLHPEDSERVLNIFMEGMANPDLKPKLEFRLMGKDGHSLWYYTAPTPVIISGVLSGASAILINITERRRVEEALQESEEKFFKAFSANPLPMCLTTMSEGLFTDVNEAFLLATGHSRQDVIGHTTDELGFWVEPDVRDKLMEMLLSKGRASNYECKFRMKSGEVRLVLDSVEIINAGGQQLLLSIINDITERKRAEEALRQSEGKYRSLFEESIDPVFISTREGIVVDANQSMLNLCGYTREEIIGMDIRKIYANPKERQKFRQKIEQNGFVKDYEIKLRKKAGTEVECLLTSVVRWGDDKDILGYQGIIRDISERKLLEAERNEIEQKAELASRLASIGEMASGIAHEINNPLTGVIGYAQLLSQKELPEDIREGLEVINTGAQRVAGIIKRLLTFARQYKPERTLVNINDIIEATLSLRSYQLKTNNIKLTTRLAPDLPTTIADAGQLQQVFLNLIVNAETEMKQAHDKGKLSVNTEQMDNIIRISFKDDGPGIMKKNMEKIFNPFFTTRKIGEGTGLGLSVCHGIIAEHGGSIYAKSRSGKGATFIIELPVITADEQLELPELIAEESQKVTNARILVVDDEPGVRQFLGQALTNEGHEVQTVDNASDALKRIRSQRYSLILLDIKMPDMSGIELYERIQKIDKSLARKVVLITGDVLGINTAAFLSKTKAPHITKPFNVKQLKKDIRLILTEGARGWARRHRKAQV
jgi:PAS domain S-box-containing protein